MIHAKIVFKFSAASLVASLRRIEHPHGDRHRDASFIKNSRVNFQRFYTLIFASTIAAICGHNHGYHQANFGQPKTEISGSAVIRNAGLATLLATPLLSVYILLGAISQF